MSVEEGEGARKLVIVHVPGTLKDLRDTRAAEETVRLRPAKGEQVGTGGKRKGGKVSGNEDGAKEGVTRGIMNAELVFGEGRGAKSERSDAPGGAGLWLFKVKRRKSSGEVLSSELIGEVMEEHRFVEPMDVVFPDAADDVVADEAPRIVHDRIFGGSVCSYGFKDYKPRTSTKQKAATALDKSTGEKVSAALAKGKGADEKSGAVTSEEEEDSDA